MRNALSISGVVLVLFGSIRFTQEINVLPGSFMPGQTRWAVCADCRLDLEIEDQTAHNLKMPLID